MTTPAASSTSSIRRRSRSSARSIRHGRSVKLTSVRAATSGWWRPTAGSSRGSTGRPGAADPARPRPGGGAVTERDARRHPGRRSQGVVARRAARAWRSTVEARVSGAVRSDRRAPAGRDHDVRRDDRAAARGAEARVRSLLEGGPASPWMKLGTRHLISLHGGLRIWDTRSAARGLDRREQAQLCLTGTGSPTIAPEPAGRASLRRRHRSRARAAWTGRCRTMAFGLRGVADRDEPGRARDRRPAERRDRGQDRRRRAAVSGRTGGPRRRGRRGSLRLRGHAPVLGRRRADRAASWTATAGGSGRSPAARPSISSSASAID